MSSLGNQDKSCRLPVSFFFFFLPCLVGSVVSGASCCSDSPLGTLVRSLWLKATFLAILIPTPVLHLYQHIQQDLQSGVLGTGSHANRVLH